MMNKISKKSSPILERVKKSSSSSFDEVASKMKIAARIEDVMVRKGISRKQLADSMGKRPSEITKWLSGTHNFTQDTLVKISYALGESVSNDIVYLNVKANTISFPMECVKGNKKSVKYVNPYISISLAVC